MKIREKLYSVALASTVMVLFLILISSTVSAAAQSASPTGYAYVAFSDNNSITVIDTTTDTVTDTIRVGHYPVDVAVNPDRTKVYVANNYGSSVSVIDATTNTVVSTISITPMPGIGGSPSGVAITPDGSKVYVADRDTGNNRVSVIDTSTNTVTDTVSIYGGIHGVAVNPDGTKVYVTKGGSNTVSVIDTETNTVTTTVSVGRGPWGVVINPDGSKVYVTNSGDNTVSVIDTATNNVIAAINVGGYPTEVAITPDGTKVYVANGYNTVSVIDTTINTVVATIPVGDRLGRPVVTRDGTKVYVPKNIDYFPPEIDANKDNAIAVIDTATNTVITTVTASMPEPITSGSLVRAEGSIDVYLIDKSEKRHFTSPEALEWNGYSFDNVTNVSSEILQKYLDGQDLGISQAIIDKYHALGGEPIFGAPDGKGEKTGENDSAGTYCSYVNFKNGSIECFANGPEDNVGNAYAIFDPLRSKWALMGYSKSVLGYPIDNMSNEETSKFGTKFRYQNFANGTEKGALEYNITSGDVFEVHGPIFKKWGDLGYAQSDLGLPIKDQENRSGYWYCDFEGGNISWDASANDYVVKLNNVDSNQEPTPVDNTELIKKVNTQLILFANNDPMKDYDTTAAYFWLDIAGNAYRDEYDVYIKNVQLYRGLQYTMLRDALAQAHAGNEAKVNRDLNMANTYGQNARISFQNACDRFDSVAKNEYFVAQEVQTASAEAAKIVLIAMGHPGATEAVDMVIVSYNDLAIEDKSLAETGVDIALEYEEGKVLDVVFNQATNLPGFEGTTISKTFGDSQYWRGKTSKDAYVMLCNALDSPEAGNAVFFAIKDQYPELTYTATTQAWGLITDQVDKKLNSATRYQMASVESPVELNVRDSQGRVTGLINGVVIEDIPESVYDAANETVIILSSNDTYTYNVVGTETGEYGLVLLAVNNAEYSPIHLKNDIVPNAAHQYTVDWNNIDIDKSITLDVDSDRNGVFEENIKIPLPTASFTNIQIASKHISFNGSSSTGDNIASYNWDFGDGTSGNGQTVDHTYANEGYYDVTLKVKDNNGGIDSITMLVKVENIESILPVANFSSDFIDGFAPLTVQFTDLSENTTSWLWDFGDGTNSTDQNPVHVFSTAGNFTVNLTVSNVNGIDSTAGMITVKAVPIIVEAGTDQKAEEGTSVNFEGSFTASGTRTYAYHWNFGDGSEEDSSLTTSHTYADDGSYTVNLTVTDEEGNFGNDTLLVTVNNALPVVGSGSDLEVTAGDPFSFKGNFSDPGWLDTHTAEWTFGEGTVEAGSVSEENEYPDSTGTVSGSFSYFDAGEYTVTLNVADDDGGVRQDQLTVTVRPIEAEVTFDPETFNLNSTGEWVTAYIELPAGYSVSGIDIGSVLLNGTVHAVSDPKYDFVTNESEYLKDLDLDGIPERMFKFNRGEVAGILKAGDKVTVTFTGKVEYNNGISSGMASFEGSDVIKVTESKNKK